MAAIVAFLSKPRWAAAVGFLMGAIILKLAQIFLPMAGKALKDRADKAVEAEAEAELTPAQKGAQTRARNVANA